MTLPIIAAGILEVLDAIHEHVENGHSLTRVEIDERQYTINPNES
jgi:hypothetical protein